jgi:uncharacterized membrane protein
VAVGRGSRTPAAPRPRGRLLLPGLALFGLTIATYLTITKLAGGSPVCGPLPGCATIDASPYSRILGVPTAAFGMGYSGVMLAVTAGWYRSARRVLLLAAYGLALAGVFVEAYLVYLQLVVIGAVCVWCAAYGLSVVVSFLVAVIELRRPGQARSETADRGRG